MPSSYTHHHHQQCSFLSNNQEFHSFSNPSELLFSSSAFCLTEPRTLITLRQEEDSTTGERALDPVPGTPGCYDNPPAGAAGLLLTGCQNFAFLTSYFPLGMNKIVAVNVVQVRRLCTSQYPIGFTLSARNLFRPQTYNRVEDSTVHCDRVQSI